MTEVVSNQKAKWTARADRYEGWANKAEAQAVSILSARPKHDHAFLTQPAAKGSPLANARAKMHAADRRAYDLQEKAKRMRDKAVNLRAMASRNAGDAAREREVKIAACDVVVGQIVRTSLYGPRKVIKVNQKTVLVEGAFGPLKIEKQFIAA